MKNITGYEGLYKIDELGNIYSLPRKGTINSIKRISQKVNKCGYCQVVLMKDNKMKTHLVHRLVAKAYIYNDNCDNLQVNHKDGNKTNNSLNNLEWVTASQNSKHAYNNNLGGWKDKILEHNYKKSFKEIILSKDDVEIKFNSTQDASQFLGTHKDNITRAFRKKQKCKGYNVICKY